MKPTLLVLAAGLGTRYGGLKQLDYFDASCYDYYVTEIHIRNKSCAHRNRTICQRAGYF